MAQSSFALPSSSAMPQPPPSLRTQMFPAPTRSNIQPRVQNVGGISKMNQRPSRQAKPKG
eukprot:3270702-Rhodomonas_salina.1